jgi:hypothetical protein
MRAWKLNAGHYYTGMRFTIMLPAQPDVECLKVCNELAASYPIQLKQVSDTSAHAYRQYWPMSFLDDCYEEDVLVYCPPHTLLASDIGELIRRCQQNGSILCGGFSAAETAAIEATPMWFAAFPTATQSHLAGTFTAELANLPEIKEPDFQQTASMMAQVFTAATASFPLQIVDTDSVCELSIPATSQIHLEQVSFFALSDAPGIQYNWSTVFASIRSVREFLEATDLSGAWLYYQRTLRQIHKSLETSPYFQQRTIFKATKSPYYIFALDYIQQSAGIRALHYLCHALNESGHEAYVTCERTVSHLRTPILTEATMVQHHSAGREPIMVYPEIVTGNPFGARTVARWLLNKPGHIAGDTTFPDNEMIFAFDPIYLSGGGHGETLHIPTSDLSLFNNEDNPHDKDRDMICVYAHKYLAQGGALSEKTKGAVSLGKEQKLSHTEIAATLRRAKLLYVYEPSALISEALLCGCPVSIVVTDYWQQHAAGHSYTTDWGVVMNDDEKSLAIAQANVHNYREFYQDVVLRNAWAQIDRFIEITQAVAQKRTFGDVTK